MSQVKIQTAAGNSLSCISLEAFGMELANFKSVVDMPTFIPKNVFGKETYLTVLEPLEQFNPSTCPKPGKDFEYVFQLVEDFRRHVAQYENSTEKVVEIEYCGYKYLWRPKHKTHYGTYGSVYLLQPIIARYFLYHQPTLDLSVEVGALPYKYNHKGTAKGIFNPNMKFSEDLTQEVTDIVEDKPREDNPSDIYTHLYSLNGFAKASTVMKIGRGPIDTINDVVAKLRNEHNITISFNGSRLFDVCRISADLQGLCLIKYGSKVEETDELSVITYSEDIPVHILFVETDSEEFAKEVFEKALGEIEVV